MRQNIPCPLGVALLQFRTQRCGLGDRVVSCRSELGTQLVNLRAKPIVSVLGMLARLREPGACINSAIGGK